MDETKAAELNAALAGSIAVEENRHFTTDFILFIRMDRYNGMIKNICLPMVESTSLSRQVLKGLL